MTDLTGKKLLRYRISDWSQLTDVRSNHSSSLHIHVDTLMQNDWITGTRISIQHDEFGSLFTCIVNVRGHLLVCDEKYVIPQLTVDQILNELERFGFLVVYQPDHHLPEDQLEYLMNLRRFKYQKIRVLNINNVDNQVKVFRWQVVAFNIEQNPQWVNVAYSPTEREFERSLRNGSVLNVSKVPEGNNWDWSWLVGNVANIEDILSDNFQGRDD